MSEIRPFYIKPNDSNQLSFIRYKSGLPHFLNDLDPKINQQIHEGVCILRALAHLSSGEVNCINPQSPCSRCQVRIDPKLDPKVINQAERIKNNFYNVTGLGHV